MSGNRSSFVLLALAHLAGALVYLVAAADRPGEEMDFAGLTLAHAQVILVALWAAFGRPRFPLRWLTLAAVTGAWCWMLARPYGAPRPLLILGSEALAVVIALYSARALGVSIAWRDAGPAAGRAAAPRFDVRDLLLAVSSAAIVFAVLRGALWLEEGDRLRPEDVVYLVAFRAAYAAFALVGAWSVLGGERSLRRGAWLATFVVGWIALTVNLYPPAESAPVRFAVQRLAVTALVCGSLVALRRQGLRMTISGLRPSGA